MGKVLPEIDWKLAWTIAFGIMMGLGLISTLSVLGRMWQDNWKITILIVICFTILPAAMIAAFLGYFGWIWLIPGFIASCACYFIATNILVKEEEGEDSDTY